LLLVGAAVLGHSFARLRSQPLGFQAQNVLTMNVSLSQERYASPAQIKNFFSDALSRIYRLPGVRNVAISSALPVNESRLAHVLAEGQPSIPLARRSLAALQSLDPSYLKTMGIPLETGRFFTESDKEQKRRVAVVNEAFAANFFPHQNPLGKRVWMGKLPEGWEVVGVIGNIKNVSLASPTQPELDIPFGQLPWPQMNLLIRASGPSAQALAGEVRGELSKKDPEQPLTNVQTLEELLSDSRSQPRLMTSVLLIFAALAFSIAIVGVYSVISYHTTQRMPEFGIRVALGATHWSLIATILKQAALISGIGVVIGLAIALALARTAASLTFGVSQYDPLSFGLAPAILFVVAVVAAVPPALRVTRLRPADVLRAE
jgi:predicted permease